ncbi:MAG: hypothetical protein A2252_10415 [Elusimicrobia bacterium RIFOXYA2_FULL_39_19]|nr:MAG: hypothetical protein A2252_10415 [Elusimicrobia bacterium RIFOXYA2_FULL_39_19]
MKSKLFAVLVCLAVCAGFAFSAKTPKVIVTSSYGKVFVKLNQTANWTKCYTGMTLDENASIKTEAKAKAEIMLYDGSKLTIKPKSEMFIKILTDSQKALEQRAGKVRYKISKLAQGRSFECKTPTAVCSIRGTEFSMDIGENDQTELKVFEGLVAAIGTDGKEFEVGPGKKMEFLTNVPPEDPSSFDTEDNEEESKNQQESEKMATQAEINMDLSKEAVQQMAATEMKLAEYQQGKTIIDVFGKRVRIEEYIVRGSAVGLGANQYKMVVLNSRKDRFDWYTWIPTFANNFTSIAEANEWVGWRNGDVAPDNYLLSTEFGASNTVDNSKWGYTGGRVIDDPSIAQTQNLVFDNYYFKLNDVTMISYVPAGAAGSHINNFSTDAVWTVNDPSVSGTMTSAQFETWYNTGYLLPSGDDKMHSRFEFGFAGGTYTEDTYSIDDYGKVPSLTDYAGDKLKYNMELVMFYDGFTGTDKKIDLCVEPKIFMDSGLVK